MTPFANYQVPRTEIDGYLETTGPFPADIGNIDASLQIARLGVDAQIALSSDHRLVGSAVLSHRMDDSTPAVDADLVGLFAVPGESLAATQDWAELTAGIGFRVGDSRDVIGSATALMTEHDVHARARLGVSVGF